MAHIQTGAAGDVVHNGRQTGAFSDGLEVPVKPLLGRFVVVRHYQQQAVNALPFGLLGKLDAFGGAVIAGAGDDRAPVADGFLNLGIQPQFLAGSQGRRLAGSSRHDHPVAAGIKKGVGEPPGLGVIHLALGVKRRNHRRDKPAQLSHSSPPYIVESATRGIPKRQSCAYYTPGYPRRNPANPPPPKFPKAPTPPAQLFGTIPNDIFPSSANLSNGIIAPQQPPDGGGTLAAKSFAVIGVNGLDLRPLSNFRAASTG